MLGVTKVLFIVYEQQPLLSLIPPSHLFTQSWETCQISETKDGATVNSEKAPRILKTLQKTTMNDWEFPKFCRKSPGKRKIPVSFSSYSSALLPSLAVIEMGWLVSHTFYPEMVGTGFSEIFPFFGGGGHAFRLLMISECSIPSTNASDG